MAPNNAKATGVLYELETTEEALKSTAEVIHLHKADDRKYELVWRNIVICTYLHVAAVYGMYLIVTQAKWQTHLLMWIFSIISGWGITAGCHRLWAHKAYKARLPLRIMLAYMQAMAFQGSVIVWAKDHRMHHKYTETDADPHNSTRGFFFAHVGWLLCKKHPDVKGKSHTVDFSDLYADPVLKFQHKHYFKLMPFCCFIIPTLIPMYLWGESFWVAFHTTAILRYVIVLNLTWLLNSAAHMFGSKPYDRFIKPVEILTLAVLTLGEGFHNFHHTFPWDYKTGELGAYTSNLTNAFLDFMAMIGWAYDLKTVSDEVIQRRVKRTGDGSHHIWGWGDKDQSQEERDEAKIIYKSGE